MYLFRITGLSQTSLDTKQILFWTTLLKKKSWKFVKNSFIKFPRQSKEHLEYLLLSLVSVIQTLNTHALVKLHTSFSSIMCVFTSWDETWINLIGGGLPAPVFFLSSSKGRQELEEFQWGPKEIYRSPTSTPPLAAITTLKSKERKEGGRWTMVPGSFNAFTNS